MTDLPGRNHAQFEEIFAEVEAPFAFVDLDAMWTNADAMLVRAGDKPVRIASKSIRCRSLNERILGRDERFRGVMTFTLPETLWLAEEGIEDLLLAYPNDRRVIDQVLILIPYHKDRLEIVETADAFSAN